MNIKTIGRPPKRCPLSRAEIQKAYRERKAAQEGQTYREKERQRVQKYYTEKYIESEQTPEEIAQRREKKRQIMQKHRAKKRALKVLEAMGNVEMVKDLQGREHLDLEGQEHLDLHGQGYLDLEGVWSEVGKEEETDWTRRQETQVFAEDIVPSKIKSEGEFDEIA